LVSGNNATYGFWHVGDYRVHATTCDRRWPIVASARERDGTIPTNARFLFYGLVQRGQISKQRIGARRHCQFTSVDQFNCAHFWSEKLTTPAAYFRHGENHRFVDRRSNPDLRGNLRAIGWEFP
jgi:hypothetical protein